MQLVDGDLVVSATDLTRFLACRHLTRLDQEVALGRRPPPPVADEALEVLFRRGLEHERAYLATLRERGLRVVEPAAGVPGQGAEALRAAEAATVAAMAGGADVVYQGTFFADTWRGHADLLLRRDDRPGRWPWSYDVADTKLARRLTVAALLQMSVYADRLTQLQGVAPEHLVVLTGDGVERPYRYDRCATYARGVRQELRAFLADPPATTPEPVRHCGQCRWQPECQARWVAEDRLGLVAQLRPAQARALQGAGIRTLGELAAADPDRLGEALGPVLGPAAAERLVTQARLQAAERAGAGPQHRVLPPEPGRGLALLPAPSPGDVFFDIEGDPYVGEHGVEYLFGVVSHGRYTAFWATGPGGERAAFEALVDHLVQAWADDPDLHVYHYAAYEPARLKALAGRYDTRVEEVDRLLRGERLVDLYTVVKQGVQVGKESYSLKKLEDHYWGHGREGAGVADALGSVVAFERWLLAGSQPTDPLLEQIRAYNEEDCRSTQALRDWLEGLRAEVGGDAVLGRPGHGDGAPSTAVQGQAERSARLRAALLVAAGPAEPVGAALPIGAASPMGAALPVGAASPTGSDGAVRLLAALLDWHRREALPDWSDHFRRAGMSRAELLADPVALAGLGPARELGPARRSVRWRLEFPPQETALAPGDRGWTDPVTGQGAGTVAEIRPDAGVLVLERAAGREPPSLGALVPPGPVETRVLRDRLAELAEQVARHGLDDPSPRRRAALDLLLRRPPAGLPVRPGESAADAVLRLSGVVGGETSEGIVPGDVGPGDVGPGAVEPGVLAVQGPPGTGKTHVAARLVLAALAAGRRVGVCAFSHAAIGGLLREVAAGARRAGQPLRAVQKAEAGQACGDPDVVRVTSGEQVATALRAGGPLLVAGTSWLFADPGLADALDLLVVDEAGQLSLANVLAVSGSARRLVLLGDPQQLTQPVRGIHPPGAGVSALDHVLGGRATIAPGCGVLLDTTYRMHPAIAAFVSDLAYDGRVTVAPGRERQRVDSAGPLAGYGLRWVPVPAGAGEGGSAGTGRSAGADGARAVVGLVAALLADGRWTDHTGAERPLAPADVLVLAPANAQVRRLRAALASLAGGRDVRVGTVDVMQGAQAPVVLVDLTATGSGGTGPRGAAFALDRHRVTVALSRAMALVAVLADPALLVGPADSPAQLLRLDALCRYVASAEQVEAFVPVRAGDPRDGGDEGRGESHPLLRAGGSTPPLPSPHGQHEPRTPT